MLVETTVGDTLPVLNDSVTKIRGLMTQLSATIRQDNAEANAIDEKHIEVRRYIMQQQQQQMQARQQAAAQVQQSQKASSASASSGAGILA